MNKDLKSSHSRPCFWGFRLYRTAAGVITKIEATDTAGGTLDVSNIGTDRNIDLTKTFTSINPITLTFTVEHQSGGEVPHTPYWRTLLTIPDRLGETFITVLRSLTREMALYLPATTAPR